MGWSLGRGLTALATGGISEVYNALKPGDMPTSDFNAQLKADQNNALFNFKLNNNRSNPFGSQQVVSDGSGGWKTTQTYAAPINAAINGYMGAMPGLQQQATNALNAPRSFDATDPNYRQKLVDAMLSRMNFGADEESLRTRLANQGLTEGSEAWNKEMNVFNQGKNDARMQALLGSGQEMQNLFNIDEAARMAPLNEANALSGSMYGLAPQFSQFTSNYNLTNPAAEQYQQSLDKYNANQAFKNQMMGGLFQLGGAAIKGGMGGRVMAEMIPTQPWQTDYLAAQRRRDLAKTLMQGVMAPTQGGMVGRYYVGEGLAGGLTRLGQALLARKYDESADQAEQDALMARNTANAQAFNDLSQSLTPQQVTQTTPTGTDGNLVQAMTQTMMRKPTPQQIGQALLKYQQTTGQQVPDSYLKMLNPEPLKVAQGETLLDPSNNSVMFSNPKTPDGMMSDGKGGFSWIPGYIGGKAQIAQAGRPTTNVNVNNAKYGNALAEAQGKSDADFLNELRGNARAATQAINTLSNLEGMSDKVFSGAGANTKLGLEQWFGGLGIPMSQQAINSENFKSIAGDLVLKQIKMLGANPTDSDRRFIEQLVPQLESSPAARLQLIRYLKQRAQNAIDDYKGANEYAAKNGSLSGYIGASMSPGSGPANDFDK